MTTLKTRFQEVVETEGTTIEDVADMPSEARPAFTIAKAVEWARDPVNAPRIEQAAKQAREVQDTIVQRIDDGVTEWKDLMVDVLMNEDTETALVDSLLSSLTGVK